MSALFDSNAIRALLIATLGFAITDVGLWGTGTELDWKATVAKYIIAVLTACLTALGVATKGRGRLV